jgi:hypothetical protein
VNTEETRINNLLVLWTTDNRDTALNMVFMYTFNAKAKGWWKNVSLLIWGASSRLLAADAEIQAEVRKIADAGIRVFICKRCLEKEGVLKEVEALGHEVFYVGEEFSRLLKEGWTVLSL